MLRVLKSQKKTKEELQPHIDRLLELKRAFASVAEEISSKRKHMLDSRVCLESIRTRGQVHGFHGP